jgi:hypothetical protein
MRQDPQAMCLIYVDGTAAALTSSITRAVPTDFAAYTLPSYLPCFFDAGAAVARTWSWKPWMSESCMTWGI